MIKKNDPAPRINVFRSAIWMGIYTFLNLVNSKTPRKGGEKAPLQRVTCLTILRIYRGG
jgi:hypothetical protein